MRKAQVIDLLKSFDWDSISKSRKFVSANDAVRDAKLEAHFDNFAKKFKEKHGRVPTIKEKRKFAAQTFPAQNVWSQRPQGRTPTFDDNLTARSTLRPRPHTED